MTLTRSPKLFARRYSDPPHLWRNIIVGSLLIHLGAIVLLQLLALQQQAAQTNADAVPIDLVAVADPPKASPVPEAKPVASKTVTLPQSQPEKPASPPRQEFTPPPAKSPQPKSPATQASKETKIPAAAKGSQSASGSAKVTASNGKGAATKPATSPEKTAAIAPKKEPAPKPAAKPVASPVAAKPVPPSNGNAAGTTPLQKPQYHPEAPRHASESKSESEGKGAIATVLKVRLANGNKDIPDVPAKPKQDKKQFSTIAYPAKGVKSDRLLLVKAVLLIDDRGKATVQKVTVEQGTPSFDPQELAQEIFQDWQFEPAYSSQQPVYSLLEVSIKIAPM